METFDLDKKILFKAFFSFIVRQKGFRWQTLTLLLNNTWALGHFTIEQNIEPFKLVYLTTFPSITNTFVICQMG
jgi:hypothetical protein